MFKNVTLLSLKEINSFFSHLILNKVSKKIKLRICFSIFELLTLSIRLSVSLYFLQTEYHFEKDRRAPILFLFLIYSNLLSLAIDF